MVTLTDLKADLTAWPDDILDQWLLGLANQPGMGWPPPDPLEGHRWEHVIVKPLSWWKNVSWKLEERDCSFDNLSVSTRKTINSMYQALIEGKNNGFGGDNSVARFQHALTVLALYGKFQRPLVTVPTATGLSVIDGNHRIFAHNLLRTMTDADLKQNEVERPAATQSIWIASHKDGEVLDD